MPLDNCGTRHSYNHGCRCPRCREAEQAYNAARAAKKRASGLCWNCQTPAVPGRTQCAAHLERQRVGSARKRGKRGDERQDYREGYAVSYPLGVVCALRREWMR